MKHLLICRHAKSSWKDPTLADFDRPLNKRGKRDAPRMGEKLFRHAIYPDLILSSSAKRARKTALLVAKKLSYPKKAIVCLDAIYDASVESLMACIHSLDQQHDKVMLVGHNPGITVLANSPGGLHIPNVPTCGIAALGFEVDSWKDIRRKEGMFLFFYYPKMK